MSHSDNSQNSENVEQKKFTFDDLMHFWTPSGVPCFIGFDAQAQGYDLCEIIEEDLGLSMYYLLTDKEVSKTVTQNVPGHYEEPGKKWVPQSTKSVLVTERSSAMLKVVKNMVGRTVSVSDDSFGSEFYGIEEEAVYQLPPIPRVLVKKMDEFFRLVHAQHGTESILLLTFDESNWSSDSWGVLVPKQENTSTHCKYDPDSVVELKPYHLSIVGSVHSHPEMAAYASGTDHEDQADFDGLHITYGWQKSVNAGATQYHIEMQMSGKAYTLKPEDVFETQIIITDPDPEVVQWTENVSKKVQPPYLGTGAEYNKTTQLASTTTQQHTVTGRSSYTPRVFVEPTYFDIIKSKVDINLPEKSVLVVEIRNYNNPFCPVCETMLDNYDIFDQACCTGCGIIIATAYDVLTDIIANVDDYFKNHFDNLPYSDYTDIYMLCIDPTTVEQYTFMHIFTQENSNTLSYLDSSIDIHESSTIDNPNYTICCGTWIDPVNNVAEECECKETLTVDHLYDFERDFPHLTVYSDTSECFNCRHYLQPTCPGYRQMVVDWVTLDITPKEQSVDSCSNYQYYSESTYDYIYERD